MRSASIWPSADVLSRETHQNLADAEARIAAARRALAKVQAVRSAMARTERNARLFNGGK